MIGQGANGAIVNGGGRGQIASIQVDGVTLSANIKLEPHANLNNAAAMLEGHPRFQGKIWYDTFRQAIMTTWDCSQPRQWVDADRLLLAAVFQRDFGLVNFGDDLIEKAAITVAQRDQRDELRDWLQSLRWDGMPRLDAWLQNAAGVPDDEYHTAVARNFIMSMVARGIQPGCKVDTMPVFEGVQGAGKSTLLRILGGKFYSELTDSLDNKDFFVSIQGRWLVEIAELDAFRKSDVTRIKQVLSSQVDRFRPPYGRTAMDMPRRTVFAGTTNESAYLRDATGARRFWPVRAGSIDTAWIEQNREQLFAEAVERLNEGATWWDVPQDAQREQTEQRHEDDTWESAIADHCAGLAEVMISDVLSSGIGIEIGRQGKAEQMRAARIVAALGFQRKKVRRGSGTRWAWVRDASDDESSPF